MLHTAPRRPLLRRQITGIYVALHHIGEERGMLAGVAAVGVEDEGSLQRL
jgi:hypothetical protein